MFTETDQLRIDLCYTNGLRAAEIILDRYAAISRCTGCGDRNIHGATYVSDAFIDHVKDDNSVMTLKAGPLIRRTCNVCSMHWWEVPLNRDAPRAE